MAVFLALLAHASACGASGLEEPRPWERRAPKSPAASGADRRLQQKISGLEYALSGYDIFFGNPSTTQGSVDPGFRKRIFSAVYTGTRLTPDGQHVLPEGVAMLPCEGSCTLDSDVKSFSSVGSYAEHLATKVWASVSFVDKNMAHFSASLDYQRVERSSSSGNQIFTVAEAKCCAYKAQVETFSPPPLSSNFESAVQWAPADYSQEAYFRIIAEFGTHFVSSAQMGAAYGQESTFTAESFQELISLDFDWWVSAKVSFLVSIDAGARHAENRTEYGMFERRRLRTRQYSLGSRPAAGGGVEAWMQRVIDSPMPTDLVLEPLSQLFDESFVGPTPGLGVKRLNMRRAIDEYCERKLVPQGYLSTCSQPKPSDPPTPGFERICLRRVEGGGGPGGLPFDDGVDSIMLHGLFSNLEVREIKSQTFRYVNGIQLVLGVGDDQWPLQPHGGRGGQHSSVLIPADSKITSVEVRYQRYIDRLTFYESDGTSHHIGGDGGSTVRVVNFKDRIRAQVGYNPRRAWLVGLFGTSQTLLDSIGFHVAFTCTTDTPQVVLPPALAPTEEVLLPKRTPPRMPVATYPYDQAVPPIAPSPVPTSLPTSANSPDVASRSHQAAVGFSSSVNEAGLASATGYAGTVGTL